MYGESLFVIVGRNSIKIYFSVLSQLFDVPHQRTRIAFLPHCRPLSFTLVNVLWLGETAVDFGLSLLFDESRPFPARRKSGCNYNEKALFSIAEEYEEG